MSALEQRRFSRDSIRHYIRRADALCRWLHDQGIALVEANQKHIQAYDVLLDLDPPRLEVRKTKFNKSRLVPIHETVADKLRQYAELRHRLNYDALSDYFFVSEQGSRIRYKALYSAFQKLVSSLGIEAREGSRRPSLHSFRHGFAVDRLRQSQIAANNPEYSGTRNIPDIPLTEYRGFGLTTPINSLVYTFACLGVPLREAYLNSETIQSSYDHGCEGPPSTPGNGIAGGSPTTRRARVHWPQASINTPHKSMVSA